MSKPIPAGHEGLIPHLVCDPCSEAIEFYKQAFGAQETMPAVSMPGSDKIMHATLTIDGRHLFMADDFAECNPDGKASSPKALGGSPVTLFRYVDDVDAAVERAVAAGATVRMPPEDMFWGDRYAEIVDPFGHSWSFGKHLRDVTPDELAEAAARMMQDS